MKINIGLLMLLLLAACGVTAFGQTAPAVSTEPGGDSEKALNVQAIQAKITAINGDKELDNALRTQAIGFYNTAISLLGKAQADAAQAAEYRDVLDHGAAQANAIREELNHPASVAATTRAATQPSELTVRELQQQLAAQRVAWADLKAEAANLNGQIKEIRSGNADRAADIAAAQRQLDRINQSAQAPAENEAPVVAEARRVEQQAQRQAAAAHLKLLQLRQASSGPLLDLLTARYSKAQRQADLAGGALRGLVDQLASKNRQESRRVQTEAKQAEQEEPAVRSVAEENVKLSQQAADLVDLTEQARQELRATTAQLNQIRQYYDIAKDELQLGGVGPDLAEELRKQRDLLPSAERNRRDSAKLHRRINAARLAQLRADQQAENMADVGQEARQLVAAQAPPIPAPQRDAIEARVRTLLSDRAGLLDDFSDANSRYLEILRTAEDRQEQLAQVAQSFGNLLDEKLLWIPNASPVSRAWLGSVADAARWLAEPASWTAVAGHLGMGIVEEPLWGVPLLIIGGLIMARRRLLRRLDALGNEARQQADRGLALMGLALVLTVVVALPGPLLLWLGAAILNNTRDSSQAVSAFLRAVAYGFDRVAPLWLGLESLRQLCRPLGLADAHFHWDEAARKVLRHNLSWLQFVYLPLIFVVAITYASGNHDYASSLGRLVFVAMSLALAVFLRRASHPHRGVLAPLLAKQHGGWSWRTRRLWYPALVAAPLLLGMAALLGYYYAAIAIEARMLRSILLIIAAVLLFNLIVRWLTLSQQKAAARFAQERRAAEEAAKANQQAAEAAGEGASKILEMPQIDLSASDAQTRALLWTLVWVFIGVGLWMIWAPLLPALRALDSVMLPNTRVSLTHLGQAILLTILTVIATRNVPGVLEIALLRRLSLDAGIRYAVNRIAIYLVILFGGIATFNAIGIGWSQVQWLAAAFTVGLGFGLQEIFANFVSGLIILFERPLRVGDIVTVDGLTGTVSRIRMRATTITDWDNKEMIIPNKTFITDKLINWTLTDSITRLVIKVAVAHGPEAGAIERLMLEVAEANRRVLRQPPPKVFVTDFGAGGAMNLELRVFVRDPADQMPVLNDLNVALADAFRKNQITIP